MFVTTPSFLAIIATFILQGSHGSSSRECVSSSPISEIMINQVLETSYFYYRNFASSYAFAVHHLVASLLKLNVYNHDEVWESFPPTTLRTDPNGDKTSDTLAAISMDVYNNCLYRRPRELIATCREERTLFPHLHNIDVWEFVDYKRGFLSNFCGFSEKRKANMPASDCFTIINAIAYRISIAKKNNLPPLSQIPFLRSNFLDKMKVIADAGGNNCCNGDCSKSGDSSGDTLYSDGTKFYQVWNVSDKVGSNQLVRAGMVHLSFHHPQILPGIGFMHGKSGLSFVTGTVDNLQPLSSFLNRQLSNDFGQRLVCVDQPLCLLDDRKSHQQPAIFTAGTPDHQQFLLEIGGQIYELLRFVHKSTSIAMGNIVDSFAWTDDGQIMIINFLHAKHKAPYNNITCSREEDHDEHGYRHEGLAQDYLLLGRFLEDIIAGNAYSDDVTSNLGSNSLDYRHGVDCGNNLKEFLGALTMKCPKDRWQIVSNEYYIGSLISSVTV